MMLHATESNIGAMCRDVASHFRGDVGVQLFDWYDAINHFFFDMRLPQAFLLTSITPYGACQGLTKPAIEYNPVILLHPTHCKTDEDRFYTVLHEAIHVHVIYNLLKGKGWGHSSHDCQEWIDECNRIVRMLGYPDVQLGRKKVVRHGQSVTREMTQGCLPYEATYRFPHHLQQYTGQPLPPITAWL